MSGFISIISDKHHVRIENSNTNVISYMLKNSLIIQKDNADTFFLKNDSYVKYMKYGDVKLPVTDSLDDLLLVIIDMMLTEVSNEIISVNEMEKADIILDVNVYSGKNEELVSEKIINTNNTSVSSHVVKNGIVMQINTVDAGDINTIIRQSKEYINVPSGKLNISLISGVLARKNTGPSAMTVADINTNIVDGDYIISKIGLFDDVNGIYIQYKAIIVLGFLVEQYSICKSVTDNSTTTLTEVLQTDWNVDECDGNGPSGVVLSRSEMNTFIFRVGTLPKTFLQVGIMHEGSAILIHEFKNEQFYTKLPMRWSISQKCTDNTTSIIEMVQNNSVVLSNENYYLQKKYKSAICPADENYKKINYEAPEDIVFDIKLNDGYNRSKLKIEKINIINKESAGIILWKLIKNATLIQHDGTLVPAHTLQTGSFADLLSLSSTQTHNGTNPVLTDYLKIDPTNKGLIISSGYIVDNRMTEINMSSDTNVLYSDIDGVSDHISLVVQYINSPADIQATVTWIEYE